MKLLFLTPSLHSGGAERQLILLAKGLRNRGHSVTIAQFYDGGLFKDEVLGASLRLVDLKKSSSLASYPQFLRRLDRLIRSEAPDIIQAFSSVPNLLALLMRVRHPGSKVVWGVRSSDMNLRQYGLRARVSYRAQHALSKHADLIISNSQAGHRHAVASGFPPERTIVIHNGIDLSRFYPDRTVRNKLRAKWNVPSTSPLIGCAGRLDPTKDHATFLKAADLLRRRVPSAHFVWAGRADPASLKAMSAMAHGLGLHNVFVIAGEMTAMNAFYSSLDVFCLSSASEGFPNVLCEAMACGVPCVATNVGDAALIVGDPRRVVPPADPAALADALSTVVAENSRLPDLALRRRISDRYSVERLLSDTENALLALLTTRQVY